MQEIINRYRSDGSDYVFPFLTSQDEDTAYREYKRKFSYYNKTLKTLGKAGGVDKAALFVRGAPHLGYAGFHVLGGHVCHSAGARTYRCKDYPDLCGGYWERKAEFCQ